MHIPIGIRKDKRLSLFTGVVASFISMDRDDLRKQLLTELRESEVIDKKFNRVPVEMLTSLPLGMAVLVRDVLKALGRLVGDDRIDWLGYRYDPTLTFKEQQDIILDAMIPDPIEDTSEFAMTRTELAYHVADYAQLVRQTLGRRQVVVDQMNNAANHLLYMVQHSGSFDILNQKEFSYLLLRFDPFYSMGADLPHPVFNPDSVQLIQPLFDYVLDSPKKDLVMQLSTRDRHNMVLSYTPYSPTLLTSQGYKEKIGSLTQLDLEEGLRENWDPQEHIAAVAEREERLLLIPRGTREQACITYNFWTGPLNAEMDYARCRIVLDDMSIGYRYNDETEGIEMVFDSTYRQGRKTMTSDPMEYYLDMALMEDMIHETPMQYKSFDEFNLVVLNDNTEEMFFRNLTDSEGKPVDKNLIKVWFYEDDVAVGKGKLSTKIIPAVPWLGYGDVYTMPVLGNYVQQSRDRLFEIDESAVEFLLNYLPLNKRMQRRNRLALAMSYNNFRKARLTGEGYENVEKLIALVTKGGAE